MITRRLLKALILLMAIAMVLHFAVGCMAWDQKGLTPTQKLTLATHAYTSIEETLTDLHKRKLIPPKDDRPIYIAVHAARAALDLAHLHETDTDQSNLERYVNEANQAIADAAHLIEKYDNPAPP